MTVPDLPGAYIVDERPPHYIRVPRPTILLPRLQLDHTPGWRFDALPDPNPCDSDLVVFDSVMDMFDLGFALDVFADGSISSSLSPNRPTGELRDPSPDALADLGNETDRLRTWLDDLAEVTQWATGHRLDLSALIPRH